jgi:hypothetical protein
MDLSQTKATIINASTGNGWYPIGSRRLKKSLNYVGWAGDSLVWYNWPNDSFDKTSPYNVKAAAFQEAINQGYTHILWCDSSVWAVQDPMKVFDIINDQGYYFWTSGFNCAQVCSDKCLEYFGVDRDTAETCADCSTSIFGVNINNPHGRGFIETWLQAARDGVFHGSRLHDNQSQDPRFLFHRQDQAAASVIIGKMGLNIETSGVHCQYFQKNLNDSVVFTLRGM